VLIDILATIALGLVGVSPDLAHCPCVAVAAISS
jgi:hypothetical protein